MRRSSLPKRSAGLLIYKEREGALEIFLVHPGGPFWVRKDLGSWSIPKGEYSPGENPLRAARREFREETGFDAEGAFIELAEIRQKGGKYVKTWAVEGDYNPAAIKSNAFSLEWPPNSGKQAEFPEIDRAAWFALKTAREKILPSQLPLLDELEELLGKLRAGEK
jgi:predicted NUDIX family NTP pyrophosphohydrolase